MIDLKPFCSTAQWRTNIRAPWTRGGYTYATNGFVALRVPARADVPDNPTAPNGARIFEQLPGASAQYVPLATFAFPPRPDCPYCIGTGLVVCRCSTCDNEHVKPCTSCPIEKLLLGTGRNEARYNGAWIRRLATLPGCEICPCGQGEAAHFRFDSGDGLIMPLRPLDQKGARR